MKTFCPHCSQSISIDPETLTSLKGASQYECPACAGAVPVPLAQGSQPGAPSRELETQPLTSSQVSSKTAGTTLLTAHRSMNRNLLILGSAALLVLGGLGFVLASRKSGDTRKTTQNIRNEIINNSYFQNLIATGVTTKADLEAVAAIRPYEDGFIGVSADATEWDTAVALAMRTGSVILDIQATGDPDDNPVETWLSNTFPSNDIDSFWVKMDGNPAAFREGQALAINRKDGARRVLLGWATPSVIPSVPPSLALVPPAATTPAPRRAPRMFIQSYSIPIEQWMDISPMLAQDHAAILDKLQTAARSGGTNDRIRRIDYMGGAESIHGSVKKQMFLFRSVVSVPIPESFHSDGGNLAQSGTHHRHYGSEFTSGAFEGDQHGTSGLKYTYIAKPPKHISMLASGTPDQMRISEVPVLEPIRLNTSVPTGLSGTHLLGAIPMAALGEKPDKLALLFAWAEQEEPVAKPPSVIVEFMLMRGISGIPQDQVSTRIKDMASAPGGIEAVTVLRAMVGGKGLISGETVWPFPTSARMTASVLVPRHLSEQTQGTSLEMKCHAANAGGADVEFLIEHHLRKPSFPVASGDRPPYLEPANVKLFRITHMERRQIAHEWTALKEFPLEPILGAKDARGKSCYLFARVISSANSILDQSPTSTIDIWIDSQGREIQGRFLRLEGDTLVIDFKEQETRITFSRLSPASKKLAMKRRAEIAR